MSKIIKNIKKMTPMFDGIITTANCYEYDDYNEAGIIETDHVAGDLLMYQEIISLGERAKNIGLKEGDIVIISPKNYIKRRFDPDSMQGAMEDSGCTVKQKTVVEWPFFRLADKDVLLLRSNDIEYIINDADWEEEQKPKEKLIYVPKTGANDSKIITNY